MSEPKGPPPVRPTGRSGEHTLHLEALSSPVSKAECPPSGQACWIDPDKLLQAWEASTAAQLELIRVVEKNEADNQRTRRFTGSLMLVAMFMLLAACVWGWSQFRLLRVQNELEAERLKSSSTDVAETLKAVRAMAKAVGASVEATAAQNPRSDKDAVAAGIAAQAVALKAEAKVAPTPEAKEKARVELKAVEAKAKTLGVPSATAEP